MNKFFSNKAFIYGIIVGILFFVIADVYSYQANHLTTICFDCYESYGFPFARYESGTILHLDQILWVGVIANISIALFSSFIVGLIFTFIQSKMSAKNIILGKGFKVGVFLSILICIFVYAVNMPPKSKPLCFDCDLPSGFPFIDYQPGNAVYEGHFIWSGLIFNILIGLFFVIISGLIFRFIWSKIAEK